jgi:glycosyltransferase involved in cell wall biosynthesis
VVYSAHNVESAISAGIVRRRSGWLGPLARLEERRTRAEERNALARARLCLAVSAQDKRELEALATSNRCPVHVVPNCVGDEVVPGRPPARGSDGTSEVVCVACFRWVPNVEGARWFLEHVMPHLRYGSTRCTVRFVGSEIDASLAAAIRAGGCEYAADVPATLPHLHRARVAMVPLLSGGGTRLKIVEAWAAGVPVVSTPLGARGLGCRDGFDALLASDAAAFAGAVRSVIEDDSLYTRLRANGLARAEDLRWKKLAPLLEDLYGSLRRLT